jgi:hypothetical protein
MPLRPIELREHLRKRQATPRAFGAWQPRRVGSGAWTASILRSLPERSLA